MRFSTGVLVALSLLASQVAAFPGLEIRQNAQKGGNKGNNGGGKGGNSGGKSGGNGGNNGGGNGGDLQSSLTLDKSVIADGFANDGQDVPTAGQVASLTSTNNFINFCATVPNFPITNGQQIKTGSCNPAPMGVIPSTDNMPSSKFVFPKNLDNIQENTSFNITMAIRGMEAGFFTNADANYFAAPQQLNDGGQITGHSHVVVEAIDSIDSTQPSDPNVFAFFKGLNDKADNGVLTAAVANGLPAGTYKLSSINTASNHQPCLVPIAQHGSLDDAVYFTVGDAAKAAASKVAGGDGNNNSNNNGNKTNGKGNANANNNNNANDNPNAKGNDNGNAKGNTGAKANGGAKANNSNADANGGGKTNDDGKAGSPKGQAANDGAGDNANNNGGGAAGQNDGGDAKNNDKDNNEAAGGKQKTRRFIRRHRRYNPEN